MTPLGLSGDASDLVAEATRNAADLGLRYALLPLASYRLTSPFGWRDDPTRPGRQNHLGVDLAAPIGTLVRSPMFGVVRAINSDRNKSDGGLQVGVRPFVAQFPNEGFYFSHLDRILVKPGTKVNAGDVIAVTGNTGAHTSGPHLHIGLRVARAGRLVTVDPLAMPYQMWAGLGIPLSSTDFRGIQQLLMEGAVRGVRPLSAPSAIDVITRLRDNMHIRR